MAGRAEHHYVPRVYLKNFAGADGKLFVYRILVSHPNVPEWKPFSPKAGIAYHAHLYTRMVSELESDEVEEWLGREFEAPAEEAIDRAVHDERLTPAHWKNLIRFAAAQDVRTPARLMERMAEWPKLIPPLMEEVLQGAVAKLEEAKRSGVPIQSPSTPYSDYLPIRLHKEIVPGEPMGKLRLETIAGRGYWLYGLRRLLTETIAVLLDHRWTILRPYGDRSWFASDDPVIKLNFNSLSDYNLNGGWGWKGTEIMLPLGPKHLLYAQVEKRPQPRGWTFPDEQTRILQRIMAEHAHRMIFSATPLSAVPLLRPRVVDPEAVSREQELWKTWHEQQTMAERELRGG